MPSTVADIFGAAGTPPDGVVPWGTAPPTPPPRISSGTGIYVVALTDAVESCDAALEAPPISDTAVAELIAVRAELTLDGARPTCEALVRRLAAFWFSDEVVLYIGRAGPRKSRPAQGEVSKRVCEYYDTPLGANRPHAGGWPLKVLSCLSDLHVHYAYCDDVIKSEGECIGHFAADVSEAARERLRDPVRVMPFANLEFPKGKVKMHGIRGARAPRATPGGKRS